MAGSRFVVAATKEHVRFVASRMRKADADEAMAAYGMSPEEAAWLSFWSSDLVLTVLEPESGRPMALFGVTVGSAVSGIGSVWLFGTDDIHKHKTAFAKRSRQYLDALLDIGGGVLTNVVDVRNKVSIAWLKWLGADFSEPFKMGPNRMEFKRFIIRRDGQCAS